MNGRAFVAGLGVVGLLLVSLHGIGAPLATASVSMHGIGPEASGTGWSFLGNQSPPRDGHGFVYDSAADRYVLFGGAVSGSTFTNSTWSYDYATNTWTNITPVVSPSPRAGSGMVYDSAADRIVLFGGSIGLGAVANDTWIFDYTNDTWTQVAPNPAPAARTLFSMAYDPAARRTILFGGEGAFGAVLSDTWSYDSATDHWAVVNVTSPGALFGTEAAYSPSANRTVLFGGVSFSGATPTFHFETWSLDLANDSWTDRLPVSHPSARAVFAFTWDSVSDRAILFGGTSSLGGPGGGNAFNDTWAYDYTTNVWTNVTTPSGPSPRLLATMDFDPVANRTILFGGANAAGTPSNDTWSYGYGVAVPSAPRSLAATAGSGRITLTWLAPISDGGSPVTNYAIYRGTTSGGETLLTTVGNVLTYDDTSVTGGVTYYYEVAAVNAAGTGPFSNEASATPLPTPAPPGAPRSLAAAPGNAQVVLTWQPPASNGTSALVGYNVYRSTSSGTEVLLVRIGVVLTYTDTAVTNGVTYYYKVSANNTAGEGPLSNEASATPTASPPPVTPPSAPQALVASAGNAKVTLSWQTPSSNGGAAITNYSVYRATSSGAETLLKVLGNVLTYTDTAVTNGVTYYYEVSANNSAGEGPKSSEAHATPTAPPPPDTTPPSVNIASPANNSVLSSLNVTVTGTASDNVAIQKVELSPDGSTWTLATGTTSWSGSLTLKDGTNTIYARATDTSGNVRVVQITVTVSTGPGQGGLVLDPILLAGILLIVVIAVLGLILVAARRRKKGAPPRTPLP